MGIYWLDTWPRLLIWRGEVNIILLSWRCKEWGQNISITEWLSLTYDRAAKELKTSTTIY